MTSAGLGEGVSQVGNPGSRRHSRSGRQRGVWLYYYQKSLKEDKKFKSLKVKNSFSNSLFSFSSSLSFNLSLSHDFIPSCRASIVERSPVQGVTGRNLLCLHDYFIFISFKPGGSTYTGIYVMR